MRIGYADPPYPGQAKRHYEHHEDYDGEVDHAELIRRLNSEYDGWVLHTSSPALRTIAPLIPDDARILAWVKPFAAFKRNVPVGYAWEPIIVKPARKPVVSGRITPLRDFMETEVVRCSIAMKKGLTGAKPEPVCFWVFEALGLRPEDVLHDMFPGTGAVAKAWDKWRAMFSLPCDKG